MPRIKPIFYKQGTHLKKPPPTPPLNLPNPPLNLPLNHTGLNILQRLRDEAHRFANTSNADLRSQKIRESVLDDFAGLGEKRRAALLAHFGSIEKLRAATASEIAEVAGFGGKMAEDLRAFLNDPA